MGADEIANPTPRDPLTPYRSEAIELASYAVWSSNSCSDHEEPWRRIAKSILTARKPLLDALEQARKERNNFRVQLDAELNKESRRKGILTKANNDRLIAENERDAAQQSAKDARALLEKIRGDVKVYWMTHSFGEIADASVVCDLCESMSEMIRARIEAFLAPKS